MEEQQAIDTLYKNSKMKETHVNQNLAFMKGNGFSYKDYFGTTAHIWLHSHDNPTIAESISVVLQLALWPLLQDYHGIPTVPITVQLSATSAEILSTAAQLSAYSRDR